MTRHDGDVPPDLRELVTTQRKLSYRSVRAAALAGRISNTRWGDYEAGKIGVTDAVRRGVARAFKWGDDWPENPPEVFTPRRQSAAGMAALRQAVVRLDGEIGKMSGRIDALERQPSSGEPPAAASQP